MIELNLLQIIQKTFIHHAACSFAVNCQCVWSAGGTYRPGSDPTSTEPELELG